MLKKMQKWLKPLASLRLAVFILIGLGVISAVGTFYESLYNADYAKLVVYQSKWMVGLQILLAINLTAVMFDRWPWKQRHIAFILAHVGILFVLLGSVLTYYYGVDGVMVFPLGGENRYVQVNQKQLSLYSSLDGNKFETLFSKDVNFFKSQPTKKDPLVFNEDLYSQIKVKDYYIFAEARNEIVSSKNKQDGPAVRFFIEGSRAKESGWLRANKVFEQDSKQLGPAKVTLSVKPPQDTESYNNEIIFYPKPGDRQTLSYSLYNSSGKEKDELEVGEVLETGWMDFKIRVIDYKPHSQEVTRFTPIDMPHALSTEAAQVEFQGKTYWLGLGQPVKIFDKDRVYILNYGKKRIDIGFNMKLENFEVGRYQGTMKAASYESVVDVGGKETVISMNEPLKKNGLTFYQSSFQEDQMGRPTHSILSVNRDPGRWLKYFGCLLIALGTLALFYLKKRGHKWRFFK